jgi:hypothetical protein
MNADARSIEHDQRRALLDEEEEEEGVDRQPRRCGELKLRQTR